MRSGAPTAAATRSRSAFAPGPGVASSRCLWTGLTLWPPHHRADAGMPWYAICRTTRCYPSATDPKPRPNRQLYLETLRRMTPEQRLLKAFELSELSHELLHAGVRQRFPDASDEVRQRIYLERLARCQNRAS